MIFLWVKAHRNELASSWFLRGFRERCDVRYMYTYEMFFYPSIYDQLRLRQRVSPLKVRIASSRL
ncbi:MAG: hypothetical protein ACE5Z5_05700 [Candidatus Bathyarchaeia archaeon]